MKRFPFLFLMQSYIEYLGETKKVMKSYLSCCDSTLVSRQKENNAVIDVAREL